ncbi:MAG: hypothetical protein GF308_09620 [Candidatus Heimdallarchaeota archaeon]|nr:hypothetical protein [Candidatus Heimdallarchaeota archaeon]
MSKDDSPRGSLKVLFLVILLLLSLGGVSSIIYFLVINPNSSNNPSPPGTTTPPSTTPLPTSPPPTTTTPIEGDIVLPTERVPRAGLSVTRYNFNASSPTFSLEETTGSDLTDIPVVFGYIFRKGQFSEGIAIETEQGNPIESEMTVLRRWADNSIKHALFALSVDSLPANEQLDCQFIPSTSSSSSGITLADVLATTFDIDVSFTNLGLSISARDLLLESSTLDLWQSNPICTEFFLAGHPRDSGNEEYEDLWVEFHVRFFPERASAKVSVVVENCFVHVTPDYTYDLVVSRDSASPETIFTDSSIEHYGNTRWRKIFWWGSSLSEPNIIVNPAYFISTGLLPKYNITTTVPEEALVETWTNWLNSDHDLLETGLLEGYMPGCGGRPDIGLYPQWLVRWFLSGDNRLAEASFGTADLAGSFPIHLRSRDTFRPITIDESPELHMNWPQGWGEGYGNCPFVADVAHQTGMTFLPYIISGDYYLLEEMIFWTQFSFFWGNPDSNYRNGSQGLFRGWYEVRGQAWSIRTLTDITSIIPDFHPDFDYFQEKLQNNLVYFAEEIPQYSTIGNWGGWPEERYDEWTLENIMADEVYTLESPWMIDFLLMSFHHTVRSGFSEAIASRNWLSRFAIGRVTHHPEFNIFDSTAYRLAVMDDEENMYEDWGELWTVSFAKRDSADIPTEFDEWHLTQEPDSYEYYLRAALVCALDSDVQYAAWAYLWMNSQFPEDYWFGYYPKMAYIP